MNVVDSSGCIAYFTDGPNADFCAAPIAATDVLVVPAITVYEVARHALGRREEDEVLEVVAQMRLGRVVDIDAELALDAARLSLTHRLAMADSLILATARRFDAVLWTLDADFYGLDGVRFIPKR